MSAFDYRPSTGTAAALGGAVIGFLAGRLLPPAMATAAGRFSGMDPFERLETDHSVILNLLENLAEADSTAARTRYFVHLKRRLSTHALAEEDVIYPILQAHVGEPEGSKILYAEHAEMKVDLFDLEEHITAEPEDWAPRVYRMHDLVAAHIRQEEEIVFPRLRRHLDDHDMKVVAGKMMREKALIV